MPSIPLETAWRRVEPRNRSWPIEAAVKRPTVVWSRVSDLCRNRAFSKAAKPKAAVMR